MKVQYLTEKQVAEITGRALHRTCRIFWAYGSSNSHSRIWKLPLTPSHTTSRSQTGSFSQAVSLPFKRDILISRDG